METAGKVSYLHNVKDFIVVSPFRKRLLGPGGMTGEIKRDLFSRSQQSDSFFMEKHRFSVVWFGEY